MRRGTCPVLALVLFSFAGKAGAQAIEIASDAAGTQFSGSVQPGSNLTLYILARPGEAMDGGTFGAEFWVDRLPSDWQAEVTPNPASAFVLGSPFATQPPFLANISFSQCMQADGNGVIVLYTVILTPTTTRTDVCLRVVYSPLFGPPEWPAGPILLACDPPQYTAVECQGGVFILNPVTSDCDGVAVERTTWGGVKRLYAD
jgi:hypothetical protein